MKLVRPIIGLEHPIDGQGVGPSIDERFHETLEHDRTRLHRVLVEDVGTSPSSERGYIEASVSAELQSGGDSSSPGLSARNQSDNIRAPQAATVDAKATFSTPTQDSRDFAARKAATELQETQLKMEASPKSPAQDFEKRLAELSKNCPLDQFSTTFLLIRFADEWMNYFSISLGVRSTPRQEIPTIRTRPLAFPRTGSCARSLAGPYGAKFLREKGDLCFED